MADTTRKNDKEESEDLYDISLLEGDEEVKEGKGLKALTPSKLLIYTNLKMKSKKLYIFCISVIKSLKKFIKI